MFDQNTKRRMETAHDIFVGKPMRSLGYDKNTSVMDSSDF